MLKVMGAALLGMALMAGATAAKADDVTKVLFVDTGNTGRSISAETAARLYAASHRLRAAFISRGVDADPFDRQVEMNAQILWAERGVDLSAHRAEQLTAQDVKHADVVLTMTAKHKARVLAAFPEAQGKTFTLPEYSGVGGEIEDAWGKPLETYVKMLAAVDLEAPAAVDRALAEKAKKAN